MSVEWMNGKVRLVDEFMDRKTMIGWINRQVDGKVRFVDERIDRVTWIGGEIDGWKGEEQVDEWMERKMLDEWKGGWKDED